MLNKQSEIRPLKSKPEEGKICWWTDQPFEKVSKKYSSSSLLFRQRWRRHRELRMVQFTLHFIHNWYFSTLVLSAHFWTWDCFHNMEAERWEKKLKRHCSSLLLLQPHFLVQILMSDMQPSQASEHECYTVCTYTYIYMKREMLAMTKGKEKKEKKCFQWSISLLVKCFGVQLL